jgi:hypothetical protein
MPEFLIDIHANQATRFQELMREEMKDTSNFEIKWVEELRSYATISYEIMPEESPGKALDIDETEDPLSDKLDRTYRAFVDPRLAQLGVRTIIQEVSTDIDFDLYESV